MRSNLSIYLSFLAFIFTIQLSVGQELVKDINNESIDIEISNFYNVKDKLFFSANFDQNGLELWQTNLEDDSTFLVKDINPTFLDAKPIPLANYNGKLFFQAIRNGINEMWSTNGMEEQTISIATVEISSIITFNGKLFFNGKTDEDGKELWVSDGTTEGTHIFKDIYPGTRSANPSSFTIVDNTLYFAVADSTHGEELWKTDGTEEGTQIVKDLNSGTNYSSPTNLINFKDTLYFTCYDGTEDIELWKSDGTEDGTQMLKNINPNGYGIPEKLTIVSNTLYFLANDGINGKEIWKTDGTNEGTIIVKDLTPGNAPSVITELISFNDQLYFTFYDNTFGYRLWKTDGADEGTLNVFDISNNLINDQEYIGQLMVVDTQLYFIGNDGRNGKEIRVLNDTVNTIRFNPPQNSYVSNLTKIGSKVYFSTQYNGTKIWSTEGRTENTKVVFAAAEKTHSSEIHEISILNDQFIFNATDFRGNELWISDQTSSGTQILMDIDTLNSSNPHDFTPFQNSIYFIANDGLSGDELWVTNGTETHLLQDIRAGIDDSNIKNLTSTESTLFFVARTNDNGTELWHSDGTDIGTTIVKDIVPGTSSGSPKELATIGNTVYFNARDVDLGKELWKSDGTEEGTVIVKDIRPNSSSSNPRNLVAIGNNIFFTANDGETGVELWKSDGTEDGTINVKDINAGSNSSRPQSLVALNNQLFFIINQSDTSHLWISDGSELGTQVIYTFTEQKTTINNISVVNNHLFFSVNKIDSGRELWTSDGTSEGTFMVKDINSGVDDSSPSIPVFIKNNYYFSANDGIHGSELWVTDRTNANTRMVTDLNEGSWSSFPKLLTNLNDTLYFTANNGIIGQELWKYIPEDNCLAADVPVLSASKTQICINDTTIISINPSSQLNGSDQWFLYANSCGGKLIDSTTTMSFAIVPSETTEYFVRGEGGCASDGICTPISISVMDSDTNFISITACETYDLDGEIITLSGNYFKSYESIDRCDSSILLSLEIINIDQSIHKEDNELWSTETSSSFQWINCDDQSIIEGATDSIFTPTTNGNYAVIITKGECVDTSVCEMVTTIANQDIEIHNYNIYPNPTTGDLYIDILNYNGLTEVSLFDVLGRQIFEMKLKSEKGIKLPLPNTTQHGVFILRLKQGTSIVTEKVVFE